MRGSGTEVRLRKITWIMFMIRQNTGMPEVFLYVTQKVQGVDYI